MVLTVLLVVLSSVALWREVAGTVKIRREVSRLEKQAAELKSKNENLKSLVEYLNSANYQEKAARERLNLQSPGEVAVALPQGLNEEELDAAGQPNKSPRDSSSNPALWWNYFFGIN